MLPNRGNAHFVTVRSGLPEPLRWRQYTGGKPMTYAHTLAGTLQFRRPDDAAGAGDTGPLRRRARRAGGDCRRRTRRGADGAGRSAAADFLNEAVVPYENDEVTRLILDSHDAAAFAPVASLTVGGFRDWLLADTRPRSAGRARPRPHARDGRRGQQADAPAGPDRRRREMPRRHPLPQHDRTARTAFGAPAAQPSDRRSARHRRIACSTACCSAPAMR